MSQIEKYVSPNFGLYTCTELKSCSILYVISWKISPIGKKAILAKLNKRFLLGLFSARAAKKPD